MFRYQRLFVLMILILGVGANAFSFSNSSAESSDLSLSGDMSVKIGENESEDHSDDESDSEDSKSNSDNHSEKGTELRSETKMRAEVKDDESDHEDKEDSGDDKNKVEIEVRVRDGKSLVKIDSDNEKSRFVIDSDVESEILSKIEQKTGLNATEIKSMWNFEAEESGKAHATVREEKQNARENADQIIARLEQKISNLENRLQLLLANMQNGRYYGPVSEKNQTQSYVISFSGDAVAQGNSTTNANVSGTVYLETTFLTPGISQFKVTGCQLTVDTVFYDCVFGKARAFSSQAGNQNSVLILAQIMDDEGEVNTMKMTAVTGQSFVQIQGPTDMSVEPNDGKIAGKWKFEASGTVSPIT